MTAVLLDLDGVLYEGERPIPGAGETLSWLRARDIPHLFVTNTTSRPRFHLARKLARLGIAASEEDIMSPAAAAAEWIADHCPLPRGGLALFVPDATRDEFDGLKILDDGAERGADAIVVGDLGEKWDFHTLNRAFRLLMDEPRPILIALGMTRYWRAEDGLRLDTAPYVAALSHATGAEPVVLGKPSRDFFAAALEKLGVEPAHAVMVGDDVRGDIGGAQAAGLKGVLVKTGKFRESDLTGSVTPDFVLDSIADLPKLLERGIG